MLREYFSCNERLEIFLTCFCNILCYVGSNSSKAVYYLSGLVEAIAVECIVDETNTGSCIVYRSYKIDWI